MSNKYTWKASINQPNEGRLVCVCVCVCVCAICMYLDFLRSR